MKKNALLRKCSVKVIVKQSPESDERVNHMAIWGKSIPGR